ncbi:MAG: hypothetical protein AAGK05_07825 [Pseudomonadota bacterium]
MILKSISFFLIAATFIIQCKAMERQNEIMLRLNRLERRGNPHAEVIPMDLPVFTTVEDLKKIPTELVSTCISDYLRY